jgi:glycosyltransferase A (GT-A) superfamily protein (DUF2064 family)
MTISGWNADRLRELGLESTLVPPGIDLDTSRPLPGAATTCCSRSAARIR